MKTDNFACFTFLQVNIRSIKKNIDDLSILLSQRKLNPDIIALSETWITCSSHYKPRLKGYNYINGKFPYNGYSNVGGVGFLLKKILLLKLVIII